MDDQMGAKYISGTPEENETEEILPRGSHLKIEHIVTYALRKVDPHNPEQTNQLIEELLVRISEVREAARSEALRKYEGQLKDMATKIIEQRQTIVKHQVQELALEVQERQIEGLREHIANLQHMIDSNGSPARPLSKHLPLSSIDVKGQEITPGQLNVMTPPRDAAYGKPVVDEPDDYDDDPGNEENGLPIGHTLPDTPEPCPTCSYPIRETTNLKCETCGWDYRNGEKPGGPYRTDNLQYAGTRVEGNIISGTIATQVDTIICHNSTHFVGDQMPEPAPGQLLKHVGCRFTGVKRTAIKDNPQA